jgi:hypothetical protein
MFPDSPVFSKILENIKEDFSKPSQFNNINCYPEPIQERAKSSMNRKNVVSTKYSLSEIKQINFKNEPKNKFIKKKNSNSFNQTACNSNREAYNINIKEGHLLSFNNQNNPSKTEMKDSQSNNFNNNNNNFNLRQQENNKEFKKSEKFNINNFMLSNEDFIYSNNLDVVKISKNNQNKKNLNFEKTNRINDSNYDVTREKIDHEKLINDYRLQLNKKLLRRLYEEREKETIRDKLLTNARDNNERKKMEKRFIFERAQASTEIIELNE